MVIMVQIPTVLIDFLASSADPVLTSVDISSSLRVTSNPGIGRGSSTNHTLLNIIKYIQIINFTIINIILIFKALEIPPQILGKGKLIRRNQCLKLYFR